MDRLASRDAKETSMTAQISGRPVLRSADELQRIVDEGIAELGISEGFIRFSAGLEHADDLIEDFAAAMTPTPATSSRGRPAPSAAGGR